MQLCINGDDLRQSTRSEIETKIEECEQCRKTDTALNKDVNRQMENSQLESIKK